MDVGEMCKCRRKRLRGFRASLQTSPGEKGACGGSSSVKAVSWSAQTIPIAASGEAKRPERWGPGCGGVGAWEGEGEEAHQKPNKNLGVRHMRGTGVSGPLFVSAWATSKQ